MQNNMSGSHELGSRQGNARSGEMKAIFPVTFVGRTVSDMRGHCVCLSRKL